MKKILVPTDFSELGEYAYNIASKIAKSTNSEITMLYVLPGPAGALYTTSGHLIDDEGNDYSEWQTRLRDKKSQMEKWCKNKADITDSISTIGDIDKAILRLSEENEIDLVIMGTEGLFSKSVWSKGSHTEYITNHTEVPVLSLKCDRSDLDLTEIVFVSDFLENRVYNLKILKAIQKAFQSKILLLKIINPKNKSAVADVYENMAEFAGINMLDNFTLNIYSDTTVESGIGKFCAERDIDLIALGTHQSKGFSRLFKHSISDDVINHLFHPILTFPIS